MTTTIVYTLALMISVIVTGLFYAALRGPYTGGYDTAALVSLLLLSAGSTVLFAAMLGLHARRLMHQHQGAGAGLTDYAQSRPDSRLLPQSEFAQRWGQRKTISYDENRREARTRGDQAAHRLRCRQVNQTRSRSLWPNENASSFRNRRRG